MRTGREKKDVEPSVAFRSPAKVGRRDKAH